MTKHIILLSDSTGDLGERMVRALITQFPKDSFTFRVYSFISTPLDLEKIFRSVQKDKPILFHTVVHKELKKVIELYAKKHKFHSYDLTGKALGFLEKAAHLTSKANLTTLHELNQEYDQRISALSFTVGHDDGLNPETLQQADIVLIGVSRTSKTPTSIYLANKGFKVANIPLVAELPFPDAIKPLLRRRTVGLTIDALKLREIRLRRAQQEKIPGLDYSDLNRINKELFISQNLFLELGCPVVDVTHHAIEETAALVLKKLHLR